jgi:hypothetical protein
LACTSVNDCVAPTICDTNGKCTAPGAGGDGGCTISAVGLGASDESSQLAWIAAVAGLTIARLRRRSGVTPSGRSQPLRWRRLGLRAERACCSEPHP